MTGIERATRYFTWFIAAFTVVLRPCRRSTGRCTGTSDWPARVASCRRWSPSLQVAALSTAITMALGTLCAIALVRGRWTKTLPIQMLEYVEERPDPTIAAIPAGLVLLAVVALVIGDRLVGLRKLADF